MAAHKKPAKKARTQLERSTATRSELLSAARESFAEHGYATTLLDDVARRAGVTKGAFYHHFSGKRELFEAVFDEEQARLAEVSLRAHAARKDHWAGMYAACRAFFEASLDPAVQRITLLDGPAVLGWERLREIEGRHTLGNLRRGLEIAVSEKLIAKRPIDPLVHMLNGAMCEAAMFVARASDQRAATAQVLAELRVMLDALAA